MPACDSGTPPESASLEALVDEVPGLFAATDALITPTVRMVAGTEYLDERRKGAPIQENVFAFGSADAGRHWTAAPLGRSALQEIEPRFAQTPDGLVHLFWRDLRPRPGLLGGASNAIHHTTYRGGTWAAPSVIYTPAVAEHPSGGAEGGFPIVDQSGTLHYVYDAPDDLPAGRTQSVGMITYRNGAWSEPRYPSFDRGSQPHVTRTADGTLVIAYLDYDEFQPPRADGFFPQAIRVLRSVNDGESWTAPINVALQPIGFDYHPRVAATPGAVHVLWQRNTDGDAFPDQVWAATSTDDGRTWGPARPLDPTDIGDVASLEVAVDAAGALHAVYYQETQGFGTTSGNRLRHARWSGGTWAMQPDLFNRTIINGQTGTTVGPGDTLHVFFEEYVKPGTPEGRFFHRRIAPR